MPPPIPAGTLLFSFKLSIGKMAVSGVPLYTNEAIAALEICDPGELDRDYLRYALMATSSAAHTNHAVLGQVLNKAKVEALPIPLRPLQEQRRVVDLLSRAESIVRMRREAEQKAKEIIPALFLDMFGDPATNPKSWEVTTLGEIIADGPQNGLYKHADTYGSGTPAEKRF
jgi:type I restriction enzyme S subunit